MLFLDVKYFSLNQLLKQVSLDNLENPELFLSHESIINHPDSKEIKLFISKQNNDSTVFNGWIEQNQSLKELLISGTTSEFFKDKHNWEQHALYEKFKFYISPFLKELIHRKNEAKINSEWAKIFSYFVLLDCETRYFLEQTFYQKIDLDIKNKLSQTAKNISESEFHLKLLFLLSDDCIAIHNKISRSSHSLKVNFVEQLLQLFFHPKCSQKLAYWMILRLEKLELNIDQTQSLEQIKSKIKRGDIKFIEQEKGKSSFDMKMALTVFSVLMSIGVLYFLYDQENISHVQNLKEKSSLSSFSINERKEIDSLLKSMTLKGIDSSNESYFSSGNVIAIQNPIKNKIAADIYNELGQDMANHFTRIYEAQNIVSKKEQKLEKIPKTNPLGSIKSKTEVEFKNDSEYGFLVIAWDESENGKVFSGMFSKKSIYKMSVSTNMNLVLIPGNEYGPIPTKNRQDFRYLKNHFCSIDFNFENALNQIHKVVSTKNKLSKILLEGALGEVITLTDSNGILN